MKKTLLLLVVLLWSGIMTKAQQLSKFEINMMPLSLIQRTQPHLRFGGKYFVTPKISVGTDLGYAPDFLFYANDNVINYNFKSIRGDLLYSINRTEEQNIYVGFEYYYMIKKQTNLGGFFFLSDRGEIHYKQADLRRTKEVFQFLIGLTIYPSKHFFLDFYSGVGYRRKFIDYSNVNGEQNDYGFCEFCFPENPGFRQGLNWSLGVKFGFVFY